MHGSLEPLCALASTNKGNYYHVLCACLDFPLPTSLHIIYTVIGRRSDSCLCMSLRKRRSDSCLCMSLGRRRSDSWLWMSLGRRRSDSWLRLSLGRRRSDSCLCMSLGTSGDFRWLCPLYMCSLLSAVGVGSLCVLIQLN